MSEPKPKEENPLKKKVEQIINDEIRPALRGDRGDVTLVSVGDDGVIQVKLKGACSCCPMAKMTLKNGIERVLKQRLPEVKEVVSV